MGQNYICRSTFFQLQTEAKVKRLVRFAFQVVGTCEFHSECERQPGMSIRTYRLAHSSEI